MTEHSGIPGRADVPTPEKEDRTAGTDSHYCCPKCCTPLMCSTCECRGPKSWPEDEVLEAGAARAKAEAVSARACDGSALAMEVACLEYVAAGRAMRRMFEGGPPAKASRVMAAYGALVKNLIRAGAVQETDPGWLPIEEAPKDGTVFLGWRNGLVAESYCTQREGYEMWYFNGCFGDAALHPSVKPQYYRKRPPDPEVKREPA